MSAWRFLDRVVSFFTFPIRSVVRQRDAEIATEIRSVRNAINRNKEYSNEIDARVNEYNVKVDQNEEALAASYDEFFHQLNKEFDDIAKPLMEAERMMRKLQSGEISNDEYRAFLVSNGFIDRTTGKINLEKYAMDEEVAKMQEEAAQKAFKTMHSTIETNRKLSDDLIEDLMRYAPKDLKLKSPELQQMLEDAKKRYEQKKDL